MKHKHTILFIATLLLALLVSTVTAQTGPDDDLKQVAAQIGTTFTYQGQLKNGGTPVTDTCDFAFNLWDDPLAGTQIGLTLSADAVDVENGLFTVELDFGDQFKGEARWLESVVQCPGDANPTTLAPRFFLSASPYALSLRPGASIIDNNAGDSFYVEKNAPNSNAIHGLATATGSIGVWGEGENNTGVFGSSSGGNGIWGRSGTAYGVFGFSDFGDAIHGHTTGGKSAVYGLNDNTTEYSVGVWGRADAPGTFGVYGSSADGVGLRGNSVDGYAVAGYSENNQAVRGLTTNGKTAIYGQNDNTAEYSTGVWGRADAAGTFGIYGSSAGGTGIRGDSTDGIAVVGAVTGANYAGYFVGGKGLSSDVLEIRGGSDLAERFEVSGSEPAEPGTLMVIDPANPGQLMPSNQPYDSKVAGVVSGAGGVNTGLSLHQEGVMDGDTQIAIAGRVYVMAEADSASIQPGDLLTASAVPGHAMKATDRDLAYGAVIGKAMSALDDGTGLVLVLVNLQ